ncbi:MAG: hypothetical protein ACO395_06705 [Pontimonas sp.]
MDNEWDSEDFDDPSDPYERLVDEFGRRIIDSNTQFQIQLCSFIAWSLKQDFGDEILWELLYAIDRTMDWSSQVVADRVEVENIMYEKHGAFDCDIWEKVQCTDAWEKMTNHINRISSRYLEDAVAEAIQEEL